MLFSFDQKLKGYHIQSIPKLRKQNITTKKLRKLILLSKGGWPPGACSILILHFPCPQPLGTKADPNTRFWTLHYAPISVVKIYC